MAADRLGELAQGRKNNFDFLRVALAALVILSHSFPLLWGSNLHEPFMRATGGQITGGEFAVAGFFILSGFLITGSCVRSRGLADYFRRRVLRIYPGFWVACLFCALVVGPIGSASTAAYWRAFSPLRLFLDLLNLREYKSPLAFASNPVHAINGSLWSIRYEFFCYIGVALLWLVGALRRRFFVAAAFAASLLIYAAQVELRLKIPGGSLTWLIGLPDYWPRLIACFLSGTVAYLYRERIPIRRAWVAASLAGLVVLALLPRLKLLVLAVPLLGSYVLLYLAFAPSIKLHDFARRGDFSYGIYLYAFPIQQLIVAYGGRSLHPLALFTLALPLTVMCAWLSWHTVERPFLALKPSPRATAAEAPVVPAAAAEPRAEAVTA
jgi:peptidoglycan/LPS O-acetylase OafA/YrhL